MRKEVEDVISRDRHLAPILEMFSLAYEELFLQKLQLLQEHNYKSYLVCLFL